jgi:glycosyltransferase involved in cell wall biosynthesis
LKIVLLPEYFYPYTGGGEHWFMQIGSRLAARGHEVEVFAFPMQGVSRTETMNGLSIRRVGVFQIEKWQPYFKRALSHVMGFVFHLSHLNECDLVIGQGSALLTVFPIFRARKVPMVCVVHDVYGLHNSVRDKGFLKGIVRYLTVEKLLHRLPFTMWLAVSGSTKTKLRALGVPSQKIVVIRNGVDARFIKHDLRHMPRRSITYLGRLVKHKHVEDFIYAISLLKEDVSCVATVAGEGESLPELQSLSRRLGLEQKILFLGRVDEEEKVRLLASSVCLVLPSVAEGWGTVLTEAAALGTPSIAYDIPGVREQAALVRSIVLVKSRDVDQLAIAIRRLMQSPDLARRLGRLGKRDAARLTWEISANDVHKLVTKLSMSRGRNKDDR